MARVGVMRKLFQVVDPRGDVWGEPEVGVIPVIVVLLKHFKGEGGCCEQRPRCSERDEAQ